MRTRTSDLGRAVVLSALLVLSGAPLTGQVRPLAGQGSAAPGAELGVVDFPTSASPRAQRHFLEGLLWLHSFEYAHARRAFQRARRAEPGFAMAHWGEAMTHNHPVWHRQDTQAGREALEKLGATREERRSRAPTERERDWVGAVEELFFGEGEKVERDRRYAEAMGRLHEKYPEDREAAAFYALALLGTASEGRDTRIYMRAAAVAEEVFRDNPRHPGAVHYLIHSYDDPVHAPLGLRAARVYSEIAPDAVHALHMPSHIFLALGEWEDVLESNHRSADAAEAEGGVSHHALHWLGYGQLQKGLFAEAVHTLERMHAHAARSPSAGSRYYVARARANYLVELAEAPDSLRRRVAELAPPSGDMGLLGTATDLYTTALLALGEGELVAAAEATARLRRAREGAPPEDGLPGEREAARVMELQLEALLRLGGGEPEEALHRLREAAVEEDAMPVEYGPPVVAKPTHELLGDVLLALGDAGAARAAYERALERAPGRALALLGLARAAEQADDRLAADRAYRQLTQMWSQAEESPVVQEVRARGAGE